MPWPQLRPYVEQYVVPPEPQLRAVLRGCNRLWLVSSHAGEADGPPGSQAHLRQYLGLLASLERRYPAPRRAASFGYAGLITVTLFSA